MQTNESTISNDIFLSDYVKSSRLSNRRQRKHFKSTLPQVATTGVRYRRKRAKDGFKGNQQDVNL